MLNPTYNFMENLFSFLFLILMFFSCQNDKNISQNVIQQAEIKKPVVQPQIDSNIIKLKNAYPDFIADITQNSIIWTDGIETIFNDSTKKTFEQMFDNPSLADMFFYDYVPFEFDTPTINYDPGRIRHEGFFKKMYGQTSAEVRKNLTTIVWLPSSANQKIQVTTINGVDKKLQQISEEFEKLPHLHKYLKKIGGTFYWRTISGTNRLSAHSFGIAIDINVKYSNYWKWSKQEVPLPYQNKIPMQIVEIFEKYGFIWGGKWYHYDTMHFEYRPELLF